MVMASCGGGGLGKSAMSRSITADALLMAGGTGHLRGLLGSGEWAGWTGGPPTLRNVLLG